MWQIAQISPHRPDMASTLDELVHTTSRSIILITGMSWLVCAIVLAGNASSDLMMRIFALTVALALASILAYRQLARGYLIMQLLWQTALVAAFSVLLIWLQRPEIALFYALVPLIAVSTLGWLAGLLAQVLVLALVEWVTRLSGLPPLPATYVWIILAFGAFGGLLGWAITHPLLTVTQWSLSSFEQARQNLAEAREQRVELAQIQEDLILSNRELARLSDRLKVLQRIAEEARQAKAEFVANVSHELRTPLNMIIGFAEIITQSPRVYGGKLPQALLTDIAAIQRNSRHLSNLVNDVLDLSQVEAGRMALSREWAALPEVIEAAVNVVRDLFESKGLYLRVETSAGLPEVFCDRVRIRQVVINLLSNAGRFTERGGVDIKCYRQEDALLVSVADTGPGIPLDDQKRIFEPFQQLDSSIRRRHGGSGLGLTISKQFVEMHGGKMWLTSQVGQGTTIYFSLPLETPWAAAPDSPTERMRRGPRPGDEYGYTVRTRASKAPAPVVLPRLVVLEKERTLQKLLSRYMQDVEVISASNVQQALDWLSHSPAQALVVNLSPLDDLTPGALAQLPFGTPTVTCWVPGESESARRLRVVQYLIKPVTRDKLLAALAGLGAVRTILVVDDEEDELHLFARMLASDQHAYRVLQVTNGQRALDMLRSRRPDVMLLDLVMPGLDGFQVLEEKGRDASIRDIPVIIISSRDPTGEPVVSNTLTVTHSSGLSVRNLVACIQALSDILSPASPASERDPVGGATVAHASVQPVR